MKKIVYFCSIVCVSLVALAAGRAKAGLPVRAAVRVPFMQRATPPPPPVVVYPAGWSNELELAEAAVRKVSATTNIFGVCDFSDEVLRLRRLGDASGANAAGERWARERDALVRRWIEDFRTNGIPAEYKR